MSIEKLEKKIEDLEDFLREFYADQMIKTDHRMTYSMYRRLTLIFKDIYWHLDGMKEK